MPPAGRVREHTTLAAAFRSQSRDADTRAAIAKLHDVLDTDAAVTAAWEAASSTHPASDGPPVSIHGDLHAGNLLIDRGRLSAVIDFGGLGVGDPACDFVAAWTLFSGESRDALRQGRSPSTTRVGRAAAASQGALDRPDRPPVLHAH